MSISYILLQSVQVGRLLFQLLLELWLHTGLSLLHLLFVTGNELVICLQRGMSDVEIPLCVSSHAALCLSLRGMVVKIFFRIIMRCRTLPLHLLLEKSSSVCSKVEIGLFET